MNIKDKEGLKKFLEEELGVRKLTDDELYKYTEVSRQAFSRWHNVGIMPRPIYFLLKGINIVRKLTPSKNKTSIEVEWTKGRIDKIQAILNKKRDELNYPYKYNKEMTQGNDIKEAYEKWKVNNPRASFLSLDTVESIIQG